MAMARLLAAEKATRELAAFAGDAPRRRDRPRPAQRLRGHTRQLADTQCERELSGLPPWAGGGGGPHVRGLGEQL